jgi:hypothetical protein
LALACRGYLAERDGKIDEALRFYLDAVRLGNESP